MQLDCLSFADLMIVCADLVQMTSKALWFDNECANH